MLRNYLLIAFRNLTQNITYTLINVFGLAVGLTGCLLVVLYISFELSYDRFHTKGAHLYRYIARSERDGETSMQTYLPAGFGPLIKMNFPEVEMYTRFGGIDDKPLFKRGNQAMDAKPFAMADPDFFRMFSFPLSDGDPGHVLSRPFTIVLAKSVADKFFPAGDALGKTIRYDTDIDFEITGVFNDLPKNSHLDFTYLTSFETVARILEQRYQRPSAEFLSNLHSWNYSTYFYLPDVKEVTVLARRMDQKLSEARNTPFKSEAVGDFLQPVGDIHFTKGIRGDSADGDMNYVYIFGTVALLILFIACFNFMNLSVARALRRAKEVGLRKLAGASRAQLIRQFLGETILLVSIAMAISIVLLELSAPLLGSFMDFPIDVNYVGENGFLPLLCATGLLTALLAGAYPAFYLSAFAPAKVLKGKTGPNNKSTLRQALVTLQFAAAIFLIIASASVFLQMRFIRDTNLGFDQENIIYTFPPNAVGGHIELLKERLLATPAVKSVTFSNGTPGMENSTFRYDFPGMNIPETSINTIIIDYDYIATFGLEVLEGRNLSREFATDSAEAYLVNEAFVNYFFLEKPIGTPIRALDGHAPGRIVGVVKDFHYRSLHKKIEPVVLRIDPQNAWCLSMKLSPGVLSEKISVVEGEWKKLAPDHPFSFDFLDETIARQYRTEQHAGAMLIGFSLLAVIISIIGLVALTSFMTEQRKKEIGIRKVLGSTSTNIVVLLSKDFLKLVFIAFIVVVPIAWYFIDAWLATFAYRTSVNAVLFIATGIGIAVVAWAAVAYQSLSAAKVNPTEILRSE